MWRKATLLASNSSLAKLFLLLIVPAMSFRIGHNWPLTLISSYNYPSIICVSFCPILSPSTLGLSIAFPLNQKWLASFNPPLEICLYRPLSLHPLLLFRDFPLLHGVVSAVIHERRASEKGWEKERGREGKDGRQRQIAAFNSLPWGAAEGDRERETHMGEEGGKTERKRCAL